jgi:hypothetical protein
MQGGGGSYKAHLFLLAFGHPVRPPLLGVPPLLALAPFACGLDTLVGFLQLLRTLGWSASARFTPGCF